VAATCVTFEIRQTLSREGLTAVMNYANRGATVAPLGTLTMIETIDRASLEIETMLPHQVSLVRTMRRTIDINGRAGTLESTERRTMRYRYTAR
jgi:hypothetical protein